MLIGVFLDLALPVKFIEIMIDIFVYFVVQLFVSFLTLNIDTFFVIVLSLSRHILKLAATKFNYFLLWIPIISRSAARAAHCQLKQTLARRGFLTFNYCINLVLFSINCNKDTVIVYIIIFGNQLLILVGLRPTVTT